MSTPKSRGPSKVDCVAAGLAGVSLIYTNSLIEEAFVTYTLITAQ